MKHIGTMDFDRGGDLFIVEGSRGVDDIQETVAPIALDFVAKAEKAGELVSRIDEIAEGESFDARRLVYELLNMLDDPEYTGCLPEDGGIVWDTWIEKCFFATYLWTDSPDVCVEEFRPIAEKMGAKKSFEDLVDGTDPNFSLPVREEKALAA